MSWGGGGGGGEGGGMGLKTLYKCCTFMYPTEVMEIFMDDFTVYGSSFEHCLQNLGIVLQRCQDKNLSLNWKIFILW